MGRPPAPLLPLIAAALVVLPGCVVVPSTPADAPRPTARPAGGEPFATHRSITRPGELVRVHETAVDAAPNPLPSVTVTSIPPPAPAEPRVALSSPPPDPPIVAALRAYLDNRPDQAVGHLRAYDPANQELLIRLLPAVAHAVRVKLTDPTDAAVLATEVEAAADAVARAAPLQVGKAIFVESAKQYGVYNPLPPGYGLLPGGSALLYVELPNAPSDPAPHPGGGDGYVTRLDCELRVRDAAGRELVRYHPGNSRDMAVKEPTRSPLRDVFLLSQFQVPKAAGTYTAEFVVRDPATGRAARTKAEFVVRP